MSTPVIVSERGQITLPASIRKKYAIDQNTPLIIEETSQGVLLKKANLIPLKTYSDSEIANWEEADKILPKDKKWLK
ncbi:MAG: AbrB/MazE/SpoVT family DNA-binding domain-containing protein [Deltaproteobacteria bacterium]|nr:AbrB/MazE/SpoVT family DNA-binding domain-containing protein [Deltaproteobacteria bacterium]